MEQSGCYHLPQVKYLKKEHKGPAASQKLHLSYLKNLTVLYRGSDDAIPTRGTFSVLKVLLVEHCPQIKCPFTPGLLQILQSLEDLHVSWCDKMKGIIAEGEKDGGTRTGDQISNHSTSTGYENDIKMMITLPKLRRLHFQRLLVLRSICRWTMACDSLQIIEVLCCPNLQRLPLYLPLLNGQPFPPPALQEIHVDGWWEKLEWDDPRAKTVLQPLLFHEMPDISLPRT